MKNIIRLILFSILFFNSFFSFGQSTVNEYLNDEQLRIKKSDSIEAKVIEFISNNFNSYNLPQTYIDDIIKSISEDNHEETNHVVTENELQQLLSEYKKEELRKLYFIQNSQDQSSFYAQIPQQTLQLVCINGGFETGNVSSYTFYSKIVNPSLALDNGCEFRANASPFVPTGINNFNLRASIINQGNEPLLASLTPPIFISRVNPNGGGNFSLKINPTPVNAPGNITQDGEIGNITASESSPFLITENTIAFNFLLIGKVVPNNVHHQPIFRYMLVEVGTNTILRNVCIDMNANDCRFSTTNDTRPGWTNPSYGVINYTPQWVCQEIHTADLINKNVRLVFQVSDCERRGHFATVYIDNLCGIACNSTWGSININPINVNCPTLPFQVCGNFELPDLNTTIGQITLKVINQSNNQVVSILSNPVIIGQNFCFTINPSIFGLNPNGNFVFEVNATLNNTLGCRNSQILTSTSEVMSFANCCQPTLASSINPLATMVREERSDWIKSTDFVTFGDGITGNGVVYHAANFVELNPGFEAVLGSQFAAYPQGCTIPSNYVYRNSGNNVVSSDKKEDTVNLVKVSKSLTIYPNPSSSSVEFLMKDAKFNRISVISIEGKKVYENRFENKNTFQLDISNFANGLYIVSVVSDDGKLYTVKLIKN